jgi:hypothetical protein
MRGPGNDDQTLEELAGELQALAVLVKAGSVDASRVRRALALKLLDDYYIPELALWLMRQPPKDQEDADVLTRIFDVLRKKNAKRPWRKED